MSQKIRRQSGPKHGAERNARTEGGRQIEALVMEILGAFYDLRAVGQQEGLVNQSGAGTWGLLRILKEEGPKTVPQVARMRSVSRQYIQKLANELISAGLVEMSGNPAHKRSKLMRLTEAGERKLEELTGRFHTFLESLAEAFGAADVRGATTTLIELRKRLTELTDSAPYP